MNLLQPLPRATFSQRFSAALRCRSLHLSARLHLAEVDGLAVIVGEGLVGLAVAVGLGAEEPLAAAGWGADDRVEYL